MINKLAVVFSFLMLATINVATTAQADCDAAYINALAGHTHKNVERAGEVTVARAGALAVASQVASDLSVSSSTLAAVTGPAVISVPVFVYADAIISRKKTAYEVARWMIKESHGAKGIHERHNDYEDNFDSPSAYAGFSWHWDLHKLAKVVLKNPEVQNLNPNLTENDIRTLVAQLDEQNVFCPDATHLALTDDILLDVYTSLGATQSAAQLEQKLEAKRHIKK